MRKRLLSILLSCAMVVSLVACGGQQNGSSEDEGKETKGSTENLESGDKIKVGVILKTLSSEYWSYVAAGVKEAGKDLGVDVQLQGPANETAYDEQNNMIETMLSSGIDAFVISPLQSDSVSSVIGEQKIPIITVDTDADIKGKVSFVGTGNEKAAYDGGVYAAKKAGKGSKAVIIGGVQGNATSDDRENGFRKGLEENGVEVVAVQYAASNPDTAANVMENMITAQGGDIQIVCCHNDDTASGAATACKQNNLSDVIIIGFDGIQSGVQNVIDGVVAGTCAQSAYQMGYKAVETAVKAVKNEKVDDFVDTGCTVVNKDNAEEYMKKLKEYLK